MSSQSASPPSPPASPDVGEESSSQSLVALALLTLVLLLAAVLLIGQVLRRYRVAWIGDAGAALVLGIVVGLVIKAAGAGPQFSNLVAFNPKLFLLVLLPTIMFDAGYSLAPEPLIRNLGSIMAFAFAGTTISTFVVGLLMWGFGAAGWCEQLGLLFNLIFGSIISATDPVTVLAVFNTLRADEDLYINVFGESVLNDAVAIVLYETIRSFVGVTVTVGAVFAGIGIFVGIFVGSVVFGTVIGFAAALLFKTHWFHNNEGPLIETGMVATIAFIAYLGAQAAHLSGICSVVSCGMVMRSFVAPNLTEATHKHVEALFKTLAGLFEIFVYVYIGLTLFLESEQFLIFAYLVLMLLALAVSRFLNIVPLTALVNWARLPSHRMPGKHQFVLWWSGLRGAMAFALAIDAENEYGDTGQFIKTCTFYIIFLTVIINGGTVGLLLGHWDLIRKDESAASAQGQLKALPCPQCGYTAVEATPSSTACTTASQPEQPEGGNGCSPGAPSSQAVAMQDGGVGGVAGAAGIGAVAGLVGVAGTAGASLSPHRPMPLVTSSLPTNGTTDGSPRAPFSAGSNAIGRNTMPVQRSRNGLQRMREFTSMHFDNHVMRLGDRLSEHLISPSSSSLAAESVNGLVPVLMRPSTGAVLLRVSSPRGDYVAPTPSARAAEADQAGMARTSAAKEAWAVQDMAALRLDEEDEEDSIVGWQQHQRDDAASPGAAAAAASSGGGNVTVQLANAGA